MVTSATVSAERTRAFKQYKKVVNFSQLSTDERSPLENHIGDPKL